MAFCAAAAAAAFAASMAADATSGCTSPKRVLDELKNSRGADGIVPGQQLYFAHLIDLVDTVMLTKDLHQSLQEALLTCQKRRRMRLPDIPCPGCLLCIVQAYKCAS